jgi:protein TIF31
MPVDVEFLQKDLEGALVGTEDKGEAYPHRVVLLRPELLELFFDSEFKRWARKLAAEHQPKEAKEEDAGAETGVTPASAEDANPAAEAAAAAKAEQEQPLDMAAFGEKIKQFDLRFNPDAFVDMPHPRSVAVEEQEQAYIPSTITDESEPAIKAVRDASVFLRTMSIPALTLDVMMGNITGMADGASLTRAMHARGINMRYLGHLAQSIQQFTDSDLKGHLASFSAIVQKEMILRAAKHVLRSILKGLAPEYVLCAISHFLNCLLGAELTEAPKAVYQPLGLGDEPEPAYVSLTVASVRERIVAEVGKRFRYALSVNTVRDVRKKQLMRELAMRCGFQLAQRDYAFTAGEQVAETEDKKKDKKAKKVVPRTTTFAPEDVLTLVPVVKTTAPTVSRISITLTTGIGGRRSGRRWPDNNRQGRHLPRSRNHARGCAVLRADSFSHPPRSRHGLQPLRLDPLPDRTAQGAAEPGCRRCRRPGRCDCR